MNKRPCSVESMVLGPSWFKEMGRATDALLSLDRQLNVGDIQSLLEQKKIVAVA